MFPISPVGWIFFGFRAFLVAVWFFAVCFALLIVSLFKPFHYENGTRFCRWISPLALKILGIRVIYRHGEKARKAQPAVFIGNHQHMLDLYTYSYTLPDRTITLGKKQLSWIPIFGWLYWLSGQIMIDRSNNARAVATMARAESIIVRDKLSILLFPEGTRSRGRAMGPFKKGGFHTALKTGLPLVPIATSSYYQHLNLGRPFAGTVIMEILDPIPVQGKSVEQLMEESRAVMVAAQDRINAELASPR